MWIDSILNDDDDDDDDEEEEEEKKEMQCHLALVMAMVVTTNMIIMMMIMKTLFGRRVQMFLWMYREENTQRIDVSATRRDINVSRYPICAAHEMLLCSLPHVVRHGSHISWISFRSSARSKPFCRDDPAAVNT
jgi:hypothetical protein